MAFAACSTVTDPAGLVAEVLEDALTFDSVPGVAGSLDGVDEELLDDEGMSAIAELGGTSAADGGTEPTDAVCDALMAADTDGGTEPTDAVCEPLTVAEADGAGA